GIEFSLPRERDREAVVHDFLRTIPNRLLIMSLSLGVVARFEQSTGEVNVCELVVIGSDSQRMFEKRNARFPISNLRVSYRRDSEDDQSVDEREKRIDVGRKGIKNRELRRPESLGDVTDV